MNVTLLVAASVALQESISPQFRQGPRRGLGVAFRIIDFWSGLYRSTHGWIRPIYRIRVPSKGGGGGGNVLTIPVGVGR